DQTEPGADGVFAGQVFAGVRRAADSVVAVRVRAAVAAIVGIAVAVAVIADDRARVGGLRPHGSDAVAPAAARTVDAGGTRLGSRLALTVTVEFEVLLAAARVSRLALARGVNVVGSAVAIVVFGRATVADGGFHRALASLEGTIHA